MESKKRADRINQSRPVEEFNTELAGQAARDARRLVAGEIDETEYHRKYHQAYLSEFGVDHRPVNPENAALPKSLLDREVSRRTAFKLAGAVGGIALASTLGARWFGKRALAAEGHAGNAPPGSPFKEEDSPAQAAQQVQMGMVIDLENCNGCLDCVYACAHHNANPPGVLWLYLLPYKDENQDGTNFLLRLCQHCGNPPCVKVCPVRARHKREKDGLVLTDYNICIGCRYCMVACPYGVNYFQWDEPDKQNYYHAKLTDYRDRWVIGNPPKGVMGKCTFCPDRQDDGRANVVCELVCTHDAIHFGDINDPNSRPRRYLLDKMKKNGGDISTFRLLESHGTKPSIIYIGHQPSRMATPVDGPVTYPDWGLVEKRLPLLEGPEPWFLKTIGGSR
ncbi:MAG: 4Fe-4S dicluster domain-containing protein [Chloroflexi bacterium]|nr:4Fe-4S dicluster domain-containing protein [Chloroflexota bacterium]